MNGRNRQARSYVRCDGDGGQVTLAFPYDPDLVAACRNIDGRGYDRAARANVFPFSSLPAVADLAARHGIEVTAGVRALAAIAARQAAGHGALPQVRAGQGDGADPAGGQARMVPSVLDEAALAVMRADARAGAGPFTDPAVLREAEMVLAGIDAGWLERVVGRPAGSWRHLNHGELLLAVRAAQADAGHLSALADARRAAATRERQGATAAAQAAARAAAARWQRLREQLPVPVTVQHNWTARHLDGYEQGADHIVVLAGLQAGRLRRAAGTPLCQTPSRERQQRHVSGAACDERRLPDCKACLRMAEKLAAAAAGSGGAAEPRTGQGDGVVRPGPPAPPPVTDDDDETLAAAPARGKELREAAHRYLENGLLPVPAWGVRQNGECCCPHGAGCGRPGKHPRSVHAGPGPGDYSWKPLACRTHADIDQRFAAAGEYAAGNLMVAIPGQMMAIDRPVPGRAVAAAPQRHRRPAPDPVRPGRARRGRP